MDIGRISIDNSSFMYYDVSVVDSNEAKLVFASLVGGNGLIKTISKKTNKKLNCYIEYKSHCRIDGKYEQFREKSNNEDFSHLVIKLKDETLQAQTNNPLYNFYIMYKNEDEFKNILYDKIYENTSIPILKEWMDEIYFALHERKKFRNLRVYTYHEDFEYKFTRVSFSKNELLYLVQDMLRTEKIKIGDSTEASGLMTEINGLDMYLNNFGDILANKIQQAFVPKFNPLEDKYSEYVNNFDDSCYYNNINIFDAQKSVIQAAVNNLDKNKTTIVVGEMGVGNLMCI